MNGPADPIYLHSLSVFGEPSDPEPLAWRNTQTRLDGGNRPTLKIYSADQLAREPAPQRGWLVKDMIPRGRVSLLYGNGGDGKSLLQLQLGVAVATGSDWIGRLPEQGGVLLVSAEDDKDEVHRRLADIIAGRVDLSVEDLASLKIIDLAGQDAILAFPDNRSGMLKPSPLFSELERLVEKHQPIMLGVDTLADVYGGDENIRAQARQFLGLLTGLAMRHDMAVVVLAHPSLSGMTSGSGTSGNTAWSNSVRSRLYLAPKKADEGSALDPSLKQLTIMKANYGPSGETISLRWERGRFVLADGPVNVFRPEHEIDQIFLDLLDQFTREGRNVTTKKGTSYAPSEFANHVDAKGVSNLAFRRSMDRLLAAKKIENVEEGSPSRRRSRLVRTPKRED